MALSDVTTAEAQAYITERLDRLGVPKALARAGAREGDEVRQPASKAAALSVTRRLMRGRRAPCGRKADGRTKG